LSKRKRKKVTRPLGQILLEIEPLLLEAMVEHDLQYSDIYGLLRQYLQVHLPEHEEKYVDGTTPVFYYGHKNYLKREFK
jgi:hypothetical protein